MAEQEENKTEDAAGDTPREAADEAADVDVDQVEEGADSAGDTPREAADEAADVDVDSAPEPDEPEAAAEREAPAPEAPKPAPKAPAAEPEVVLGPKERRRQARSAHSGEAGPALSPEERIQRRADGRRRKATERQRYRKGRGAVREAAVESGPGTPKPEREPGNPKVRQGIVVSNKMEKTITVRVESARRHPAYEKVIRSSKMFHAHDERNEAGPGDTVRLIETRPMSKTKHWRLIEILERAK